LPFYAILRAVPSKLGGVVAMGASIGILFLLPAIDKGHNKIFSMRQTFISMDEPKHFAFIFDTRKGPRFRQIFKFFFSLWVFNFLLLGILGGKPVEFPYSEVSVAVSLYYFSFFFFYF